MNKLSKKYSKPLILISIALAFITIPVEAAVRNQQNSSQTKIDRTHLAFWSELMRRLGRRRRDGGSKGPTCLIAPQRLDDPVSNLQGSKEIWNMNPLFLWNIKRGNAIEINLFEKGSNEVIWSRKVPEGDTSITYDGKPLKPGQSYRWRVIAKAPFKIKSLPVEFEVMESQQRLTIAIELAQLEQRLKKQGTDTEKIAMEKARYFADERLWSDMVREIYTVKNPSSKLKQIMLQIPSYDYCD